MGEVRVRARVATTHAIEAYGGMQLPKSAMTQIAEALRNGVLPMHFQHDISRPVAATVVESGVERMDDGEHAVWVEFDVEEEVWAAHEAEVKAANAPGGFSIAFTSPVDDHENDGASAPDKGAISGGVAADKAYFTADQIEAAANALGPLAPNASEDYLYQLSEIPDPKVVFDLVLGLWTVLAPNIASSALYDAAKHFLLPDRKTVFNICFKKSWTGRRSIKFHLATDNAEDLRAALDQLPAAIKAGAEGTFQLGPKGYEQLEKD